MAKPSFNIEWDAHEYEHKERGPDWFWTVGIITASIAVVSVIFSNIIFAILILVGSFSLSIFASRPPEHMHVVVDEGGITRENVRYPYDTLHSFWIDTNHPHRKIILRSEKLFMPYIVIPLNDEVDGERLTRIMSRHIQEEYHALPLVERLLDALGF